MKKVLSIGVILVIIFLSIHWIIWKLFSISIIISIPYRNRHTQKCLILRDNDYKPPWFNLFYKPDQSCPGGSTIIP